jgi:hypothetical protein
MLALSGCGVMRSGVGGNEGSHHAQRQVVRLQTSGKITKRADIAATVGGAAGTAQSLTRIRDVGRVIIGDLLSHTYIAESEQTIASGGQPNSCTWLTGMVNQIVDAAMRQQIAVVINLEAMNTQAEPLDQRLRLCNGAVILVTKLIDDDTRAGRTRARRKYRYRRKRYHRYRCSGTWSASCVHSRDRARPISGGLPIPGCAVRPDNASV